MAHFWRFSCIRL